MVSRLLGIRCIYLNDNEYAGGNKISFIFADKIMIPEFLDVEKVKKHFPALRHELIMIYSGRSASELQTMEQREALRQETKEVISKALDKYSNSDGFRNVFFTEFLVN